MINVQFSDDTEKQICAYFSDSQPDEKSYPNQGQVELSDARWKSYYESLNPIFQQLVPDPE